MRQQQRKGERRGGRLSVDGLFFGFGVGVGVGVG